jgi:hypothetical protein
MATMEPGAADRRSETDSGQVTVARMSPEDMQERELYVAIDGHRRGILRYGDSLTVPISAGHHKLRVHNTISRKYAEFDIIDGEQVCFRAANVRGKGFAMLAMFFGIAPMYTVLEREDCPIPRAT